MARYQRTYSGERRTDGLRLQLTPSERAELEAAAEQQGATLSQFSRELLFRRAAAIVAATRRNPEAKRLADELNAIGNNLNQLARIANTTGELRHAGELQNIATLLKQAISRVLAL